MYKYILKCLTNVYLDMLVISLLLHFQYSDFVKRFRKSVSQCLSENNEDFTHFINFKVKNYPEKKLCIYKMYYVFQSYFISLKSLNHTLDLNLINTDIIYQMNRGIKI